MQPTPNVILGIDIGGTGMKSARVDIDLGVLLHERDRTATPQPATPAALKQIIGQIVKTADWTGPIGCTFPSVVQNGVVRNATNLDASWAGVNVQDEFSEVVGRNVLVINDADAAGIAEMRYGAGTTMNDGVVVMLTFGTGIGSAVFLDGKLLPNTEFGDLELDGKPAELQAAGRLCRNGQLTWDEWLPRVQRFLDRVELLFSPDMIIFGGGISAEADHFLHKLKTQAELVPAKLRNNAGIAGAAFFASRREPLMARPIV